MVVVFVTLKHHSLARASLVPDLTPNGGMQPDKENWNELHLV